MVMVGGFRISRELTLPSEAATWVSAFLAKRNAGKTYDAAVLAEEFIKAGIPIVVIDGIGVWWGLRVAVRYEGEKQVPVSNKPGMPVVVFGGDHADLPLVPEKAAVIARSIVESGISAVIDISQLSKNRSRRIVGDFLYELYRINKNYGIRHVMVEESDQWAPQKAPGDVAYSLGAVDEVVRRGGNFNLGCTLITQRSAVLNKDVLTQADQLVVLRTLAPQDKKAIQAWVEEMTDEDRRRLGEWYDSLKELRNGEAWVWHPDKPVIFKKVMFRRRETLHATREFFRTTTAKTVKMMDVTDYIEKFRIVFEPKPKQQPEAKPKSELAKATELVEQKHPHIVHPIQTQRPLDMSIQPTLARNTRDLSSAAVLQQALPTIVLEKVRPTLEVTTEPSTALGRVLVVLANYEGREDRLTGSKIKTLIRDHAWPDDGADEAIDQLLQWEILRRQSNNYLRFYRDRVQVVERAYEMPVA